MTTPPPPEAWLRGPVPGIAPELMPAAHMVVGAAEEIARLAADLAPEELWLAPGGAASLGFHLRHLTGACDRLLAYARGEPLTEAQLAARTAEREPGGGSPEQLVAGLEGAVERVLEQLRATPRETLQEPRPVGRERLPSTVMGVLYHLAEHAQRHAGQFATTKRILRGLDLAGS